MAQLDNAADSDSEDRGFESLRAGQIKRESVRKDWFSFYFSYTYSKGFEHEKAINQYCTL